jgi:hypothetical protein
MRRKKSLPAALGLKAMAKVNLFILDWIYP